MRLIVDNLKCATTVGQHIEFDACSSKLPALINVPSAVLRSSLSIQHIASFEQSVKVTTYYPTKISFAGNFAALYLRNFNLKQVAFQHYNAK